MRQFAQLYTALDATTRTGEKVAAMRAYFAEARPGDAAWAVYFLSGRKLRQVIPSRLLRQWVALEADIPDWLFDECYEVVGDFAETLSLALPTAATSSDRPLADWVEQRLVPLRSATEPQQREALAVWCRELSEQQRFVLLKLMTGAFRVGVSARLVTRAVAEQAGLAIDVVAHRLMGQWQPSAEFFAQLTAPDDDQARISRPYPFFLAHPLQQPVEQLGAVGDWQVEWKWDGIRAQLIRRGEDCFVWSRGEELMAERFPEVEAAAHRLPTGVVLDGEILAWRDGVLPFAELQRRIGRKKLSPKILDQVPVVLIAFDLLESGGRDIRDEPLAARRRELESLLAQLDDPRIQLSPLVDAGSWAELADRREQSRDLRTEGLMLKRRDSAYGVGRPRGSWWKWKVDPYHVDAVLIYAQRGTGRRASLYTDYTFAVWDGDRLVSLAKAYSGLTDEEIREVDGFVRRNTLERFGPVRAVKPELVFELAFENIQVSSRHKSGIAVRFPRITRWRRDKTIEQADRLETVKALAGKSEIL